MDVAIVGVGNWGSSLAYGCVEASVPLREVVVRTTPEEKAGLPVVGMDDAKLDARVIWICVRDGEIGDVTERVVARRGRLDGQIVAHSSGALSASVLEVAKRAGARVGSVAPVMSFPTRRPVSLRGVMFAVEAEEEIAADLEVLVRKLGGEPFLIASEKKALYHAAATMASPLLLSEVAAAMAAAKAAGLADELAAKWVGALVQTTVRNFAARGVEGSFSGPFARGDAETIRLHLQVLGAHPMLKEIYGVLAKYAVEHLPVLRRDELKEVVG
ncbi:MAG TPA: Rossmann-like and DUF2520 domain-containing protein [Alloacidobacterium sp.]|nr:Rossmann-like and DUF2520 domain-containing protein [Alloacidobacterium sp.]